jgi:hypothetical protein
MGDQAAWQILLETSRDAIQLNRRGMNMRVDDVAGKFK